MNLELRDRFTSLWNKYFGDAELPIVFYYSYGEGNVPWAEKPKGRSCIICELGKVRNGISLVYNTEGVTCGGARRYRHNDAIGLCLG